MAIKAGSIIHVGQDTVLIDRIQTAGPGQVNIPRETIYELGNYQSVGQIFDTPDLSFSMDSYDVSCEIEAFLCQVDPTTVHQFDLAAAPPVDIKSAFKAGKTAAAPFDTVDSVGIPYLALESASYKFGMHDNATQTFGLRGDSLYYNPGSTYIEKTAGTNAAGQAVLTSHAAYSVDEGGATRRVLCVMVDNKRLVNGVDYTESYGTVTAGAAITTVTLVAAVPLTSNIRLMYASPTVETFLQTVHAAASATKPAAIRGRDIAVYLGGYNPASPAANLITGIQSANIDWRVTLQRDEEFGNYHYVDQDFDVPAVSGSIVVRPADPADFLAKMRTLAGVTDVHKTVTASALPPAIPLDVVLKSPVDASVLKRIHVPDARFVLPGLSARVQQKLDLTANFNSDSGAMTVTDGTVGVLSP